eukprot:2531333-Amphidinium_carterae.1
MSKEAPPLKKDKAHLLESRQRDIDMWALMCCRHERYTPAVGSWNPPSGYLGARPSRLAEPRRRHLGGPVYRILYIQEQRPDCEAGWLVNQRTNPRASSTSGSVGQSRSGT